MMQDSPRRERRQKQPENAGDTRSKLHRWYSEGALLESRGHVLNRLRIN